MQPQRDRRWRRSRPGAVPSMFMRSCGPARARSVRAPTGASPLGSGCAHAEGRCGVRSTRAAREAAAAEGPPRRGDYEFTMSMTSRCARRRSRRRGPRGAGINAHNVVVCMVHVRTLTLSLNTRMKSKSSGVAAEAPPSGGPGGGKPAQPSLVSNFHNARAQPRLDFFLDLQK